MHKYKPYLSIKDWAEEDRPREKLLNRGRQSLTDAELLAIILGSGSREGTAVDLARNILSNFENDLGQLGQCSVADLLKFRGVGEAKAIAIVAALELGRRRELVPREEKPVIRNSTDAYRVMAPLLLDLHQEEFWLLLLNQANRVIARRQISLGGINKTLADARVIFRCALEDRACSIILFHNHPSGALQPSQADVALTEKLFAAGGLIDIQVLDHIIVAGQGYYSFADEGKVFADEL